VLCLFSFLQHIFVIQKSTFTTLFHEFSTSELLFFHTITGKIEKYERLGMPTPKGMVIDTEGKERTDTAQVKCLMDYNVCFPFLFFSFLWIRLVYPIDILTRLFLYLTCSSDECMY